MKNLTKKQADYIEEFSNAFTNGLKHIAKAAEIYVKAIDENHEMKTRFAQKFEGTIPAGAWSGLEAVGRKQMHPKVMLGVGRNTSFIKRLPYSEQEAIVDGEKVELLTVDGDSLRVDPRDINAKQSKQLFGGDHIRSLSEQKAYLEDCKRVSENNRVEEAKIIRYRVENGNVHFSADTVFSTTELIAILAEVNKK